MEEKQLKPVQIFYCYASKDKRLLEKLEEHISPLKRSGEITAWSDREIQAGMDWANEIEEHLNTADIILLLVSPSFIASDLCYSVQMQKALDRHKQGKVRVIPIILRPILWEITPIGRLKSLPKNNKSIMEWRKPDAAFLNVAIEVWRIIKDTLKNKGYYAPPNAPSSRFHHHSSEWLPLPEYQDAILHIDYIFFKKRLFKFFI